MISLIVAFSVLIVLGIVFLVIMLIVSRKITKEVQLTDKIRDQIKLEKPKQYCLLSIAENLEKIRNKNKNKKKKD